jgi:hypothetical protein
MITKTDRAGTGLNKVPVGLKRIVAVCIAAVCVIGCMQTGIVTAKAEDEESEMDFVKECIKECVQADEKSWSQFSDEEFPRGSSDLQTYLLTGLCGYYDYKTPGDHYYPESALLIHVDENKLVSVYASDGVNKWPIEYSFEDDKGNYIGWTTDGVNINIVKHSDADYTDYYDIDTKKPAHTIYMNYDLSVAPTPDIPAPPVSEKVDWKTDPGSFYYAYDDSNYGYVSGKYTTYISAYDDDEGDVGLGDGTNVVIRSTKITSISKKAFAMGDIKEIKKVKIYLPEEKFKAYKTMLLKVSSIKKLKKAGKVKFYTLNKWNGKILAHRDSYVEFATEPDYVYGATQATTRGEWYDENVIASREDSLKNTNVKKGSKAYKRLVEYGEYSLDEFGDSSW